MLDLKLLMYCRADEIEKLQKMKADFDTQLVDMLRQVKDLSESKISLQQKLDELKVTAQAVMDMVDLSEEEAEAPFTLVEQLRKVPQGIIKYHSETTRQYVSGLVKSYWPYEILAPLGKGMNPDCDEIREVKMVADRIVDSFEQ